MKIYPLLTLDTVPSAIILVNGTYPEHPLPLTLLDKAAYVVCCDGAMNAFVSAGRMPAMVVGDGDSLSAENKERFAPFFYHDADQETNDQTKAVRYCIRQGKTSLLLLGATGKREDHTLGNISLLADYVTEILVEMATDYGVFTPIDADACFESRPGQQISIFSIDPVAVTVENLLYPIENRILTSWWQGTLNEALGDSFTIRTTGRVIVFRSY